ncbi:MAG: S8 family serine peptidase [Candidatus Zixiibacteriota bacterium]
MSLYSKNISFLIIAVSLVFITCSVVSAAALSPSLENMLLNSASQDSLVSVIVFVDGGSECLAAKAIARGETTLRGRHEMVVTGLKTAGSRALEKVETEIYRIYPEADMQEYWIAPALVMDIPVSLISAIADLPGVSAVIENAEVEFIEPVESNPAVGKIAQVYNHITSLNIPALWKIGLNGRGRLVCSFDTGVEGTHPALASKWRGNSVANSAAWFAPTSTDSIPFDRAGHGTHTMGLMVGSISADSFGVAPGAEWITAAVIDQGQTLSKTIADILAAFQWATDPDGNPATVSDMPDVILNSWGIPTTVLPPCDATFNQVIDNVEAAGIVTVYAAGNEGPEPQSLRLPANRASSPLNAFAVGAIDQTTNVVAGFSSRGPSSCDTTQKKPEVVAPGVNIYSCTKDGSYAVKSGTSMAAPLIAGIVALLRQYNPDATVEEIKNAIIMSARDLGTIGEDNNYGHGLPDAFKALSFIPAPPVPDVYVSGKVIGGDGIAMPGETFDLFVRLEIPGGSTDTLTAFIATEAPGVSILDNDALFFFSDKSIFSVNISPFVIRFDSSLVHGSDIEFKLYMQLPYQADFDTLALHLTVGYDPKGEMFTHSTSSMNVTVSDFGQFGFGPGSIYPAGGAGLTFCGSENLLYEAGIIVGRNSLLLSSSVRDSSCHAYISDFGAEEQLATVYPDIDGGYNSSAMFTDNESAIPIPVTINQSISSYDAPGDDGFVIIKYDIINSSNENLNGIYFGFLSDFDLDDAGDLTAVSGDDGLIYQSGGSIFSGIQPLTAFHGMRTIANIGGKKGLTDVEKYNYISYTGVDAERVTPDDYMTLVSFGPYNLAPGASREISFAIVMGESLDELNAYAVRAKEKYNIMTDIIDQTRILPKNFTLHQNYPNPFNPTTVINFDIDRATDMELSVFNTLGQKVATLFEGHAAAGSYQVVWDGTNKSGQMVASGIYFYKLTAAEYSETRKMLLVK